MSDKIYEAESVDAALDSASQDLGVDRQRLQHEVVEEKSGDFWGFGDTSYRVRVWVEEEEPETPPQPEAPPEPAGPEAEREPETAEPEAPPEPAPEPEAPPEPEREREPEPATVASTEAPATGEPRPSAHTVEEVEDLPRAVTALLNRVFEAMEFDCTAEARLYEDQLHVAISGEDNQFLLEGRGRGLSALELLLNHGFRHRDAAEGTKIRVDAGDFKSQREDEIRDLAYQVAHQAKETNQPQETRSLNPYERRIVHLTLADDPKVTTRSQGDGFMKVVKVIPQ